MKNHPFEGKVTEEVVVDGEVTQPGGFPVVKQVKGAPEGARAQVCAVCGGTAAEDGTTPDHPEA